MPEDSDDDQQQQEEEEEEEEEDEEVEDSEDESEEEMPLTKKSKMSAALANRGKAVEKALPPKRSKVAEVRTDNRSLIERGHCIISMWVGYIYENEKC